VEISISQGAVIEYATDRLLQANGFTTEGFVTAEDLAARMKSVGFKQVEYQRFMFGTIAIHWGEK
jgi:ubiquinone/menaquinone biosynthesis C-methylase UbiE